MVRTRRRNRYLAKLRLATGTPLVPNLAPPRQIRPQNMRSKPSVDFFHLTVPNLQLSFFTLRGTATTRIATIILQSIIGSGHFHCKRYRQLQFPQHQKAWCHSRAIARCHWHPASYWRVTSLLVHSSTDVNQAVPTIASKCIPRRSRAYAVRIVRVVPFLTDDCRERNFFIAHTAKNRACARSVQQLRQSIARPIHKFVGDACRFIAAMTVEPLQ